MTSVKRITDLTSYKSVLPYASEMFGVYQPLIGWRSKRTLDRVREGLVAESNALLSRLTRSFRTTAQIDFNQDCAISVTGQLLATIAGPRLTNQESIVLQAISTRLATEPKLPPTDDLWLHIVTDDFLNEILRSKVTEHYNQVSIENCRSIARLPQEQQSESNLRLQSQREVRAGFNAEAAIAGAVLTLVREKRASDLNSIFFTDLDRNFADRFQALLSKTSSDSNDPYLTFDPKKDAKDVTLSPLGIVHLYRQYFFELDTFLGSPTGHVWLSPGSSVELIEVSTRKTTTERTVETSTETTSKTESSSTDQDELSEAVKSENKDDLKLGITATVNQSWGTGNASATASLNMDKTQSVARDTTHKRMRQQTEKLSTEIRQNYKSTFKTVTEVTDMSSKRYVLANTGEKLINYELRRKMRQVGVQVQDIGSYLCWETFIDEAGGDLGLASLIHIAKPADLLPIPDQTDTPYPADTLVAFQTNVAWTYGDDRQFGFAPVGFLDPPPAPEGFEVIKETGTIPVSQVSGSGEDFNGVWAFGGRFTPAGQLTIGVLVAPGGMSWDERIDFVVAGALRYTPTAAKKADIDAANKAKKAAGVAATLENDRKTKEEFIKAVKERVELAASVTKRKFEDLRDEERIIVYRRLITSLMTSYQYTYADDKTRHILSQLINSIFDVDKMLYFVAPEWWKPRNRAKEFVSVGDLQDRLAESVISWADGRSRPDNYLITDKSLPAPLGSSLGWLLQLDGDDLRNAFLNAPWVKAVIPVRPGKEEAAMAWLQNVNVEGSDGLDAAYDAPSEELNQIIAGLGLAPGSVVTIKDAIRFLCQQVAAKHDESNVVKSYPDTELNVDNKVSSTPVEKVYEHGFYPLQGGFRVNPQDPDPDPNNKDTNFQIFDQWIEVLPTDQMVPVEVSYDPKTGRQL